MTDSRADRINKLKQEFGQCKLRDSSIIYSGFSERLNFLIDITNLEIPSINNGRVTFLSEIFDLSRPVIGEWITKDRPPKDAIMFEVASFLAKRISDGETIPVAQIVSWLRYGDDITCCPFKFSGRFNDPGEKSFLPLAAKIIATEARLIGLSPNQYDLRQMLDLTISTLKDFELVDISQVKEIHRQIIRQHFPQTA